MAKALKTNKDFLVIAASRMEVVEVFKTIGVCDSCNNSAHKGFLIPVLGSQWYCPKCFKEWHSKAKYFKEDQEYEHRVFTRYCEILNIDSSLAQ